MLCIPWLLLFLEKYPWYIIINLNILFALQGYFICLTLALGYAFASILGTHYLIMNVIESGNASVVMRLWERLHLPPYRNRAIKQMKDAMKNGNSLSFLCHDINELEHSYQANLPRVTVVMPLKGFGEHNLHNWRSQVRTHRINSSGYYLMFLFSSSFGLPVVHVLLVLPRMMH